jgi:hypothetical protein
MKIQLIQGHFSMQEAIDIVTRMIHVKIKFHEDKIEEDSNEETIKMRETRIKQLQRDLHEMRKQVESASGLVDLHAEIAITA